MTASPGRKRRGVQGAPRTTHARIDPITSQIGLFRATSDNPKDQMPGPPNGIVYQQIHDGIEVQFRAAGQMDATDWRHFLAIAALSGMDANRLNKESDTPPMPTLWDRFVTEGIALRKDGLHLKTTAYALLREAGLTDTGSNRKRLSESLVRLSMVRQFLRKGTKIMSGANLISFAHDEDSGELSIGLSPQMARTILGESKQHVRINLEDVRALKDSAAVILHAVLSARLRPGDRRPAVYYIDTLALAAFGPTDNASTKRNRRPKIKEALAALGTLPQWRVHVTDDKACIWRGDFPRILGTSDIALWLKGPVEGEPKPPSDARGQPFEDWPPV